MNTKGSQDIEQTMFSAFDKLYFVFLCNEHSRLTSVNVMNFLGQAPVFKIWIMLSTRKKITIGYLTTKETNKTLSTAQVIYMMDNVINFFNNWGWHFSYNLHSVLDVWRKHKNFHFQA